MKPTAEQDRALSAIREWAADPRDPAFCLGGYAGTGKSTLMRVIAEDFGPRFIGPTGKSVTVLRSKLPSGLNVTTAHSYLYTPREITDVDREEQARGVEELMSGGAPAKSIAAARERLRWIEETLDRGGCDFIPKGGYREPFIVCDECSMVSEKLRDDILSRGDKVLFVGDPGQLPPVKGRGFFEVNRPNAMLEEVHRQARGSRILQLATAVRLGERFSAWGGDCERVAGFPGLEALDGADQVITGTNKTRLEFNLRARRRGGFERGPKAGEPLICLRNDHALRFMNGLQATTLSDAVEQPLSYTLDIEYDGQLQRQLTVDSFHFDRYSRPRMTRRDAPWDGLPEFDFGYCVTVHKAQGSEWPWVVVLDDDMRGGSRDFRQRWIYTAATRASERLTWVRPRQ